MRNLEPNPDPFFYFDEVMRFRGWILISETIPHSLVSSLKQDIYKAVAHCNDIRKIANHGNDAYGTAHHLLGQGESFFELLENFPGFPYVYRLLGDRMVLNSYAGTLNTPNNAGYIHRVHRDIRFYVKSPLMMLNVLVLLEDFTEENGGTYLMTGSHCLPDKPSDDFFKKFADRIIAPAGSILIFNSNIWHSSGINKSSSDRPAVSMTFSSPEIQPQYNFSQYTDKMSQAKADNWKQLLGCNTQAPNNLEQAYQLRPKHPFKM